VKNHLLRIKFLIIAILLFVTGLIIDKSLLETDDYEINIEKFESVLHKKEAQLEMLIDTFKTKVTNQDYKLFNSGKNIFFDTDYSYLTKEDFAVLIFQNDSLKYWSSNLFEIGKTFTNSELSGKIAYLNNAWYETKFIDVNEFKIVGLLKIKNHYLFENQFIVNDFAKGFNLPSSLKISKIPLSFSFEIENKDGEYIFSIVPSNTIITAKEHSTFAAILYLISFLFFIFYLHSVFKTLLIENNKKKFIPIISLVVILLRILMIKFKLPVYVYSLNIFDPSYYAESFLFPSLGDFVINSLLISFFLYYIFKFVKIDNIGLLIKKSTQFIKILIVISFLSITIIYFLFIQNLLGSLIEDSSLSFEIFNILSLDLYSIIAILTYSILLGTFIIISDKIILDFSKNFKFKYLIYGLAIISVITTVANLVFNLGIGYISILYFIIVYIALSFIRYKQKSFKFYSYVLIVFITTIYSVAFLTQKITKKQKAESKLLITQLVDERDVLAELLLTDIEKDLEQDETVKTYIQKPTDERTDDKIETYLKQKYFNGYWNKYYLDVTIFSNIENMKEELTIESSKSLYDNKLDKYGINISNSDYYFIDNKDGSISYIIKDKYYIADSMHFAKLYITLDSKLLPSELGYPELLIDQTIKPSVFQDYTYAKYKDNELISKSANYLFDNAIIDLTKIIDEYTFFNQGKYRHLVYKTADNTIIILTKERIYFIDLLITFAYLFVFFNSLLIIFVLIRNIPLLINHFNLDFRNKLMFSMIFLLLLSFVLIGGATVYYNVIQYKNKHNENIKDKIQSISITLEQEIGENDSINILFKSSELSYLDYMLRDISEVFFSDINLYNLQGYLIATSRPEIYNKYLIGSRLDQMAFYEFMVNNKSEIINNEKIGNLEFTSAYISLKNKNNQEIAFINVPYFIKPSVLQEEISNLLVTVINLYVMLFIVAIVFAIFLSEQIISPLRMIQSKFQKLELGKKHEVIDYQGKDEIGELVREYNRMVMKLDESIDLLAKSERESAWREMAKQVAHEIKNPLTPMKLKIQYLLKSWENNDVNFDKKIREVSETLIEQIETLSRIATEFSSFAKIPVPNEEVFNLVNKIENIAQLYDNTENVEIETNLNGNKIINIKADKEQVSRVFINLIKNGIQSIPDGVRGKINVDLVAFDKKVTVSIQDNGTGISEEMKNKLFLPSFTTKSSGMGLGLSIVKNIVKSANGEISFESVLGKGSKFIVEFPLITKE